MHSPSWVAQLVQRGHDVRVATTRKALRFVRREALESLTHRRVYSSIWQRDDECPVPHINLAEWADVVLICPATATTIARIAQGSCVDLVSALAISTRAPVIVVPSMNPAMYGAPSVQRNLDRLREDGFHLVHPASGIEVAHAPDARTPVFGPAPPFEDVLAILSLVMATRSQSTRAPATAAEWDALYAAGPPGALPWARDDIDGDIATALAETSDARRALEVGTGTGTTAIAMAQRGLNVIATDVSSRALEWARSRPGAESVTWLQDDILASRLQANFDVAVDRGCLHLLPRERHPAYVRAMAQRVRAGGRLILKVHSEAMTDDRKTHRFARDELAALFQPEFEPIRIAPSTLPGPGDHAPPAWLAVFRRL
jgi:SAM-dependent methyltransferase